MISSRLADARDAQLIHGLGSEAFVETYSEILSAPQIEYMLNGCIRWKI